MPNLSHGETMEKGDLLKFDYTARAKDTGIIFDTTIESVAKENKLSKEDRTYGSVTVWLGEDKLFAGMEEALLKLKEGEEKEFTFTPEKAFGERNPELVRVVPIQQFKRQGIQPVPGMSFTIEGRTARVQSVSGGRVRVDFNPEYAGRTLVYKIKVVKAAKTDEEKASFLFERIFGYEPKVKVSERGVEYALDALSQQKQKLAKDIEKALKVKNVRFTEEVRAKEEKK